MTACNFARTVPTTSSLEGRALLSTVTVRTATGGDPIRGFLFRMTRAEGKSGSDDDEQARKRHRQFSVAPRRTVRRSAIAQFDEDALEWTEAGEGGLKHVEADKGRRGEASIG